ncbi:MAG TPA: sigma-70 family RNA polymerase sigma factor [Lacipirellulaceae bacterium]
MSEPFDEREVSAELLGRLLDEHGPALALYAAQWTASADDCVQEALMELARQPQEPQNVLAWLYRVVKHRAMNAARSERRRREREARSMRSRFIAQHRTSFDRCDTIAIADALERLGSSEREIVVMRIWGGLTYDEIAAALSTSTAGAYRQYQAALETLRKILESPCSTR